MNIKHYIITGIIFQRYISDDEFLNDFLQLVYLREGLEGIVEVINHIANNTPLDEDRGYAVIYDKCYSAIEKYLLSKSK